MTLNAWIGATTGLRLVEGKPSNVPTRFQARSDNLHRWSHIRDFIDNLLAWYYTFAGSNVESVCVMQGWKCVNNIYRPLPS